MSIFDKLEEIREKPIEKRKKILFFSLTTIMAIVILIWLSLLTVGNNEKENADSGPSPLEIIKNTFKNVGR